MAVFLGPENIALNKAHQYLLNTPLPWNIFNTSTFSQYINDMKHNRCIINIRVGGQYGATLLHTAVELNNKIAVELLLANGADRFITDYLKRTPLELAMRNNSLDIVKILADNSYTKDIEIQNKTNELSSVRSLLSDERKQRREAENKLQAYNSKLGITCAAKEQELKAKTIELSNTQKLLSEETRKRKRAEDDLEISDNLNRELKRIKLTLEESNAVLLIDNKTLIDENKKIMVELNNTKDRYETLKKTLKK